FERLLFSILAGYPNSWGVFRESMIAWLSDKLWVKSLIKEKLKVPEPKILFSEHHLSHAASAFFCSPYKEAAILTVDGVGEWTTASYGRGQAFWNGADAQNSIQLNSEIRFPHSVGLLYSAFTAFLGFEVNEGEYKVMGMAPYGQPKYVEKVYKLIHLFEDGSFVLDMSYFSFYHHHERTFNDKFVALFGQPRNPKSRFVTDQTSLFDDPVPPTQEEIHKNQYYADIAASIQKVTEEIMVKMANHLHKTTGLKKLCLAGGVALNSVANYRILRETPFEEIYIQPAAGDSGGAIGAALYAYHVLLGKPRVFTMEHAYWGKTYGNGDVHNFLTSNQISHQRIDEDEKLFDRIIDALLQGKVIGWYQGGFEWGPRALGNRSILADARNPKMKDIVNIKIKFREPFRPFAPSVIQEACEKYFDLPDASKHYPARFMLYVTPVKKDQQANLPAITHADGTGRLQTVFKQTNPRYHRLIEKFGEATGVPVLLNTSFNLKGEPIVTTPANAFNTFSKSGMDMLVLDHSIVEKK
ncbi:MAG: hypothetical protein HYY63_02050, partial [Elusimicrobia bacterium]|nr:hypothetical protein [Elusimicrobiota bacterium]